MRNFIRTKSANAENILMLTAAILFAALLVCGYSWGAAEHAHGESKSSDKVLITSAEQLNDPSYTVGVGIGDACELSVKKDLPKATIKCINTPEAYAAVQQGKIDAYAFDYMQMSMAINNGVRGVRLLDETIGEKIPIAVGISPRSKIPDLTGKVNKFIDELKSDGTLDDMYKRWVVDENETMPEIKQSASPSTHLIVGTSGGVKPFSYYSGTDLNGYDIELAYRFAAWLDADVEFKVYDYSAIVIAAHTGDVDCVMANLNVTPERQEAMLFSEPLLVNRTGLMVRTGNLEEKESFMESIAMSFEKTFVREDRWRLFLYGIGTTLLITVLSILFGIMLGFTLFMACRHGNRLANRISGAYVWLIQGMPVVVLLMILYYVVFGSMHISGTLVAVIGFTLIFGASVYGMLKTGTGAIDIGQTEAAYTLGYTDRQAFFKVVLPQALPHIIPILKGEISSLVKATSVVGYIAVQDLTKMGDIIRSRTYEAFFPLIAIAVMYFILAGLLKRIVERIEPYFNPKRRDRREILKGVDTK